jgi:hypothetical protein
MRLVLFLSALAALQTTSAVAQSPMPACDGDLAIVRVSEIKPGGTMQGFLAAVDAHKAWYRANGITDSQIFASRVILRDQATRDFKYSDKQVLTYHIRPAAPDRTPNRGDEAWKAYVKLYQDNSEIKDEYLTCIPKHSH